MGAIASCTDDGVKTLQPRNGPLDGNAYLLFSALMVHLDDQHVAVDYVEAGPYFWNCCDHVANGASLIIEELQA